MANRYNSKHVGVGGIKCPCCAARDAKRRVNRELRRKARVVVGCLRLVCGNRIIWGS